jgi:hypothetical protein
MPAMFVSKKEGKGGETKANSCQTLDQEQERSIYGERSI